MALTFPLALSVFADKLPIKSLTRRPGHQQEYSGLGSGAGITADVAPALREFDVTLAPLSPAAVGPVLALIEALGGMLNEFYLYDPTRLYPQTDPTGSVLGANVVTINALNVNNKAMRLQGLPAGYVLTAGDMISWDYSSNPTRRAFHRIVETVTASGLGVTPEFEVRDFIRPGSSTGLTVALIKPAMKAKMMKDTLRDDVDADTFNTSVSFSVKQVI